MNRTLSLVSLAEANRRSFALTDYVPFVDVVQQHLVRFGRSAEDLAQHIDGRRRQINLTSDADLGPTLRFIEKPDGAILIHGGDVSQFVRRYEKYERQCD